MSSLESAIPYLVSIGVIAYGTLLVYTMNMSIKNSIEAASRNLNEGNDDDNELELCQSQPLKFQAIAIGVIIAGVIALLITMFSHHPKMFSDLVSFGDSHKQLGGHPYFNTVILVVLLIFLIYMWRKDSDHKHCMSEEVGKSWGNVLFWTNRSLVVGIILYLIVAMYLSRKDN